MRIWRSDFKNSNYDPGYDLFDDWSLIEASFAQQYGIRLRMQISNMQWGEFASYISGLNYETPLGNIIRIRKENDPEELKKFTPEERKIRNDWLSKNKPQLTSQDKKDYEQQMHVFKNMFKGMARK